MKKLFTLVMMAIAIVPALAAPLQEPPIQSFGAAFQKTLADREYALITQTIAQDFLSVRNLKLDGLAGTEIKQQVGALAIGIGIYYDVIPGPANLEFGIFGLILQGNRLDGGIGIRLSYEIRTEFIAPQVNF